MKIQELQVGMKIRHPQYGEGVVQSVSNVDASILFGNIFQTIDPDLVEVAQAEAAALEAPALTESMPEAPAAEATADQELAGDQSHLPLRRLIESTLGHLLQCVGVETPDAVAEELGVRWQNGKVLLRSEDPSQPAREVPIEVFFQKIVGIRDGLRVLERRINSNDKLSSAEKFDMQQYIARNFGTMTTFNLLFRNKEDQFSSKGE